MTKEGEEGDWLDVFVGVFGRGLFGVGGGEDVYGGLEVVQSNIFFVCVLFGGVEVLEEFGVASFVFAVFECDGCHCWCRCRCCFV